VARVPNPFSRHGDTFIKQMEFRWAFLKIYFPILYPHLAAAVSAPVTAPLKVASNVIREGGEAFGVSQITAPLSTLASAPDSIVRKGEGLKEVLPNIMSSVKQLAPLAAGAAGALSGTGIGLDGGLLSALSGMTGTPPGELNTPTDEMPTATNGVTGAPQLKGANLTVPILIGGGALFLIFMMRKK